MMITAINATIRAGVNRPIGTINGGLKSGTSHSDRASHHFHREAAALCGIADPQCGGDCEHYRVVKRRVRCRKDCARKQDGNLMVNGQGQAKRSVHGGRGDDNCRYLRGIGQPFGSSARNKAGVNAIAPHTAVFDPLCIRHRICGNGQIGPLPPSVDAEYASAQPDQNPGRDHTRAEGGPIPVGDQGHRDKHPELGLHGKHPEQGSTDDRPRPQQTRPGYSRAELKKAFCPTAMLMDAAGQTSAEQANSALRRERYEPRLSAAASKAALTN
jgi:hypothetical protein